MNNPLDYLTQGFSREQLTSIGKRQMKMDAPKYASDLVAAPLPPVAQVPEGFNRDSLKAIGEGKLKGEVTFADTSGSGGPKTITGVPMFHDATQIIPIEAIDNEMKKLYEFCNARNPIRIK